MKKLFVLIALLNLNNATAVCFEKPFEVSGYGLDSLLAEIDAEKKANEACGADDYNWSSRRSNYTYEQISDENLKATARFQCCSSW
jgi:hypothetical protein